MERRQSTTTAIGWDIRTTYRSRFHCGILQQDMHRNDTASGCADHMIQVPSPMQPLRFTSHSIDLLCTFSVHLVHSCSSTMKEVLFPDFSMVTVFISKYTPHRLGASLALLLQCEQDIGLSPPSS